MRAYARFAADRGSSTSCRRILALVAVLSSLFREKSPRERRGKACFSQNSRPAARGLWNDVSQHKGLDNVMQNNGP
jgi:hypothetical protein